MSKQQIKKIIENKISENRVSADGMFETGVKGVKLFQVTRAIHCAPAVYEPAIVAIVNGSKEAILDGKRYVYGSHQYLCCTMLMPLETGAPAASLKKPLIGVYISRGFNSLVQSVDESQTILDWGF